jgi:hypothetical protein
MRILIPGTATNDSIVTASSASPVTLRPAGPPVIQIMDDDGTTALATITVTDGKLDVTGPEERWTEAAQRFVTELRRMTWG